MDFSNVAIKYVFVISRGRDIEEVSSSLVMVYHKTNVLLYMTSTLYIIPLKGVTKQDWLLHDRNY